MIKLSYDVLKNIAEKYGDSFYLLDSQLFEKNYIDMLKSFRKYYSDTHIAYSYKTNYTPKLCKIINQNGGYAEIVSGMEMWLALKLGVEPCNIYYNGPYKKREDIEKILLLGGHVNCDSQYEVSIIKIIAKNNPNKYFTVGIRCSLDIGQKEVSRFGFDTESEEFAVIIKELNEIPNVRVTGLHCHLPFRTLDSFAMRMRALRDILKKLPNYEWDYISLGGGYMGKVDNELAKEFMFVPPTYEQYAAIVAGEMGKIFSQKPRKPKLIIEPGSALVANVMKYVTKVIDIKCIKGKYIASTTGSTFCINPSIKGIKRPIEVYSKENDDIFYEDIDIAGYTCIESDYIYKGYSGYLSNGSFIIINNIGSYSIVMKPPFILPEVAMLEIKNSGELYVCREEQKVDEIFKRFLI